MSAAGGPKGKGGSAPSEAELRSRAKAQELLAADCVRVAYADINQPFTTLRDAVERLLPYHVRGDARPGCSGDGGQHPRPA